MTQWEYHIYTLRAEGFTGGKIDTESMDREINALGTDGWQLVSTVDTNYSGGGTRNIVLIFKREKQN
jgi:hypothetical protein